MVESLGGARGLGVGVCERVTRARAHVLVTCARGHVASRSA